MTSAFVQVSEVWTPRGGELALDSGAYGEHQAFARISEKTTFPRGRGLPGTVWSSGKPHVWADLGAEDFVRLSEAREARLDAGIGIPIVSTNNEIQAVVTLLCGSRSRTGGCIERWDVHGRELRHAGGYYGRLDAFARFSPNLCFRIGSGLPGQTLERGLPLIEQDTRESSTFIRADLARKCGVTSGIGIPIYRAGAVEHVIVLLSTEATPLARAFEVWLPTRSGRELVLDDAHYGDGLDDFAEQSRSAAFKVGEGLPGKVFQSELPIVFDSLEPSSFVRHEPARRAGLEVGVGLPIHDGRSVRAVVVLLS